MIDIPRSLLTDMPLMGFGTSRIPSDNVCKLVKTAINVGYNHIDCADSYQNEIEIGKCFEKLKNRQELYIVSKLWAAYHEPHMVKIGLDKTLNNLKCEYLDMYLMHTPFRMNEKNQPLWLRKEWILETWNEMIKLRELGNIKRIGVSNFTTTKLEWLIDESEKPCNNQVELHPYLPQNKLVDFCRNNDIEITGYLSIGNPTLPEFYPSMMYPNSPKVLDDKIINKIAIKHKTTPAKVLLKWGINRKTPVLVKSSSESRMKENLDAFNLKLDSDDMNAINNIDIKCRYFTFRNFIPENRTPEELFDGEFFN